MALVPPLVYVIGTWIHPGHGPPYMFSNLWGPDSSHSTVGLVLLFFSMIVCRLTAAACGAWLARHTRRRASGWSLVVAGLTLLVLNLMTRQP